MHHDTYCKILLSSCKNRIRQQIRVFALFWIVTPVNTKILRFFFTNTQPFCYSWCFSAGKPLKCLEQWDFRTKTEKPGLGLTKLRLYWDYTLHNVLNIHHALQYSRVRVSLGSGSGVLSGPDSAALVFCSYRGWSRCSFSPQTAELAGLGWGWPSVISNDQYWVLSSQYSVFSTHTSMEQTNGPPLALSMRGPGFIDGFLSPNQISIIFIISIIITIITITHFTDLII